MSVTRSNSSAARAHASQEGEALDIEHHNERAEMTTDIRSTVVVGVDGTKDGQRAVWYGTALASREGLDLRLVHVAHETFYYTPMTPFLPADTLHEIGRSVLHEAAKLAEEAGFDSHRTSTVLAEGPRTAALLSNAEDARYIVLGTRASIVQHLLTGATTLSVVAHSRVPVHCVPRSWREDRSESGRLVVGADWSDVDDEVLHEAFAEAKVRGATLEIVHAWRPVSPYDAAITGRVLHDDWDKAARDWLTQRIAIAAATATTVKWTLRLELERTPVALHEAAVNADLLILGRHSHKPSLGLLVGSNTRTLLHAATCPVVVVPVASDGQ
jgi:nucleotide-binding universal stress UspA family protein